MNYGSNLKILWDIYQKAPIRTFVGHQGPVQALVLLKPIHVQSCQLQLRRILTASLGNTDIKLQLTFDYRQYHQSVGYGWRKPIIDPGGPFWRGVGS